jgi:hypothetical protein
MEDNSMFSGRRPPLQLLLTFFVYFLAFFITGILLDFFRSKTFTTGEIKDDIYHALLMAYSGQYGPNGSLLNNRLG